MNFTVWLIFGLLLIMIMAIVSNTGQTATANIQQQMDTLGCDYPDFNLGGNSTGNGCIDSAPYNSTGVPACSSHAFVLWNATGAWYSGGAEWVACLPMGWFDYIGDLLSVSGSKAVASFTLVGYVLAPINFDVLGFTIADLSGVSLMVVIGLYVFAYIPIGVFVYKAILPFTGIGG